MRMVSARFAFEFVDEFRRLYKQIDGTWFRISHYDAYAFGGLQRLL